MALGLLRTCAVWMMGWEWGFALGLLLAALGRAGKRPAKFVAEVLLEMVQSAGRPAMQVCSLMQYTAAKQYWGSLRIIGLYR